MTQPLWALTPSNRVLITGGEGMLGRAFASQVKQHAPHWIVKSLGKEDLDVRDASALAAYAPWIQGGWIVHCAGLVDVEGCARDPEHARAVIVDGTRNVLSLAARAQARVLYPQSFLIYDGQDNPIAETETPRPLALYGQLKYEAQRLVEAASRDHLVVCMAGFLGGEERDKNFVGRFIPHMRKLIEQGVETFSVGDRVWQPTWTEDLAANSLSLMATNRSGFYQMACHGEASFYDLACAIVEELGWQNKLQIVRVDAASVSQNELGKRPARAVLSCQRLRDEGLDQQRDWRIALKAYLGGTFFDSFRNTEHVNDLSYS